MADRQVRFSPSPGIEGIERSSKKSVAGRISEFIEKTAVKPSKLTDKWPWFERAGSEPTDRF
jgi:hypothetical protein